ncbi:unnamed protein product [Dracunculus medinensis]|uniref:Relaxase n=1 Tax=Dracunculus medinensis TaxID=318479 RepID=A0A0N4UGY3_DRAME|nr:unnamed protein product [Dracunculus medinensis]
MDKYGYIEAAGVKTRKFPTYTLSPISKGCTLAEKKANGERHYEERVSKHSEIYQQDARKDELLKECLKYMQTLENDQAKEIPWQNKALHGLHHWQIIDIAKSY